MPPIPETAKDWRLQKNNKSEWSPFKKNQVYLDTFSCVSVNFKLLIFGVYRFGSDASQGNWGGWRPSVAPGYARIVMPRMFEVTMERVGLWQRKWEYSTGTKDFLTYCLRGLSSRNWVSCIGSMKLMKTEWLRNASWFENCRIKLKTAGGGSGTWVVMRESSWMIRISPSFWGAPPNIGISSTHRHAPCVGALGPGVLGEFRRSNRCVASEGPAHPSLGIVWKHGVNLRGECCLFSQSITVDPCKILQN